MQTEPQAAQAGNPTADHPATDAAPPRCASPSPPPPPPPRPEGRGRAGTWGSIRALRRAHSACEIEDHVAEQAQCFMRRLWRESGERGEGGGEEDSGVWAR